MTTRLIIPCAGGSNRWGQHRGVPKHLVPICGEPVLERTVRLANEIVPGIDVRVVVPDLSDGRYKLPGSQRFTARLDPDLGDVDKVASSSRAWSRSDTTIIAWGDIWWTRDALTDVLTRDIADGDWHAWLRIFGDGGELFAFAVTPDALDTFAAAIDTVAVSHQAGAMPGIPGGWALYRTLTGHDVDDHADHGHATHIDDWTDDFDTADDWKRWCYRYGTTDEATRSALVA